MRLQVDGAARLLWALLLIVSIATVQADVACGSLQGQISATEFTSNCGNKGLTEVRPTANFEMDISNDDDTTITSLFGTQIEALQFSVRMENNQNVETINFGAKKMLSASHYEFALINNKVLANFKGGDSKMKIEGTIRVRGNRKLSSDAILFLRSHAHETAVQDIQELNECGGVNGDVNFDFTDCKSIYGNLNLKGYVHSYNFYPVNISGNLDLTYEDGKVLDVADFLKNLGEVKGTTKSVTGYCLSVSNKKRLADKGVTINVADGACDGVTFICSPDDVLTMGQENCATINGDLNIDDASDKTKLAKLTTINGRLVIDGVKDLNIFPELETVNYGTNNESAILVKNVKEKQSQALFPKLASVTSGAKNKMEFKDNTFDCSAGDVSKLKPWANGACGKISSSDLGKPGSNDQSAEEVGVTTTTVVIICCAGLGAVILIGAAVLGVAFYVKKKREAAAAAKRKGSKSKMATVEGGEKSDGKEPVSGAKESTEGATPSAANDQKSVGNAVESKN